MICSLQLALKSKLVGYTGGGLAWNTADQRQCPRELRRAARLAASTRRRATAPHPKSRPAATLASIAIKAGKAGRRLQAGGWRYGNGDARLPPTPRADPPPTLASIAIKARNAGLRLQAAGCRYGKATADCPPPQEPSHRHFSEYRNKGQERRLEAAGCRLQVRQGHRPRRPERATHESPGLRAVARCPGKLTGCTSLL